jgi:hypothetical protein
MLASMDKLASMDAAVGASAVVANPPTAGGFIFSKPMAVIEALRTYSPFANKCPFDSTASGRVMRVKRAHSVSVATAKCFIDLIGTAMRATPPDLRSPPVAIMVGLGLAKYLVYVAVHGAVGTDGTAGTDGTDDGTDETNGAKEAIDTLKYASAQCGLSLTELIVTGSLVLRAVENKLDSFASDLVALLAAERETHRVVSVALFSDAPLPLLAMVHRSVREEYAERIAGVRDLVSRLTSITADFGISADQDLYRPVASLIDRAGARVAELERGARRRRFSDSCSRARHRFRCSCRGGGQARRSGGEARRGGGGIICACSHP